MTCVSTGTHKESEKWKAVHKENESYVFYESCLLPGGGGEEAGVNSRSWLSQGRKPGSALPMYC